MRPRMILIAAAAVALAVTTVSFGLAVFATGDGDDAKPARAGGLAAKTEFAVTLDTHSEELDMDLVAGARLVVDDTEWPATSWEGDGPSGHHREGRLRFDATGPAAGPVEMTLEGFPEPVAAQWTLDR